jgi:CDP-diacylglycerol--serine O-phosphatidyltransferase
LLLYLFTLKEYRSVGWIVALVLAMAAALRLARFNVMLDDPDKPEFAKDFFVGVPAPAGALCALLPIYLHFIGMPRFSGLGVMELGFVLLVAYLMVSRMPTYAGKTLGRRVPREHVLVILILAVLFFVLLATYPFEVLVAMVGTYLICLPVGVLRYKRLAAAHAAEQAKAKPPDKPDTGSA